MRYRSKGVFCRTPNTCAIKDELRTFDNIQVVFYPGFGSNDAVYISSVNLNFGNFVKRFLKILPLDP